MNEYTTPDAPEAPVWMDGDQAQVWQSGWEAGFQAHAEREVAVRERETFPAPAVWSHILLPEGAVMVRRFDVEVGDVLVSSHYGRAKVVEVLKGTDPSHVVDLRFEGHGEVMQYLRPVDPNRIRLRNERYDGDSLIPLLPKGV